MKKNYLLINVFLFVSLICYGQLSTVVQWTFPKGNASDTLADGGSNSNIKKSSIKTVGGTSGLTYTSTGSATFCVRATGWQINPGAKAWQVKFSTLGFDSLYFSSKQRSNISGPRYFIVQYKIGSTTSWANVNDDTIAITTGSTWGQIITDSLPRVCNNTDSVFLRWIVADTIAVNDTAAILSNASSSIDDIIISGHMLYPDTVPSVLPKPDPDWFATGDTIALWTFSASDSLAEYGNIFNFKKSFVTSIGGTDSRTWNNGYGRALGWQDGNGLKYWQTMVNTTGYDSIVFSSMQRSNASGPKHFMVQYKLGLLGQWKIASTDTVNIETASTWEQKITDSLPSVCKNRDSVFLRWIVADNKAVNDTGVITSAGSSGIDNIVIRGRNISGVVAPYVLNASVSTQSEIIVVFSKPVNTSAEIVANYTGIGSIQTASRAGDFKTVTLTLAAALTNGKEYTLTIANVEDTLGNKMLLSQNYSFVSNSSVANVVITEIMYADPGSNFSNDSLEYIELYNNSSQQALVGGYALQHSSFFSLASIYKFPAGAVINGKSYVVMAKNPGLIDKFYGITGSVGWITGQSLSNIGESIQITNTFGDFVDSLTYSTSWDTLTNGYGYSLELCNAETENSDPLNWKASNSLVGMRDTFEIYGTPGKGCKVNPDPDPDPDPDPVTAKNIKLVPGQMVCYPNPAVSNLTIVSNAGETNKLSVYNIFGVKILEKSITGTTSIDVSDWLAGIYILSGNNLKTKLIISR